MNNNTIQRDLFHLIFDNNQERYNRILELIIEKENYIMPDIMTIEQTDFLRQLYLNLLFRIAFLEYRGYKDEEISIMLNLSNDFELMSIDKLFELKRVYRDILDEFIKIFEEIYKSVVVTNENNNLSERVSKIFKRRK